MSGKTYTKTISGVVAAGGNNKTSRFKILSPGNKIKVRRITVAWLVDKDSLAVDLETQELWIYVGMALGQPAPRFALSFTSLFESAGLTVTNGTGFVLYGAGAWEFDSLEFPGEMLMTIEAINNDPANNLTHRVSLAVETFEEIIY